jgi:selenoprotein W-related protein
MSESPAPEVPEAARPRLRITYCTQCRWLLRATWLAGELLTSFTTDLGEVALRPGIGGVFTVEIDDELVWDRKRDGGFPDLAPLKRLVRDRVAPGRSLGHTDRHAGQD